MNLYPFRYFWTDVCVKFGADGLHAVPFGTWQFHDTLCSEGHILLKGVNEIFPYLVHFGLMRIKSGTRRISHNAVEQFGLS